MRPEGDIPAGKPSELHRSGRLSEELCGLRVRETESSQSAFRDISFRYCTRGFEGFQAFYIVNGSLQLSLPVGMMAEIGMKKNTAARGTLLFRRRPIFFLPWPKSSAAR